MRLIITAFALLLVTAACSTSADTTTTIGPDPTSSSTSTSAVTTTTIAPTTTSTSTTTSSSTTTTSVTTTTAPTTTTTFPGTVIDFGPRAGDVLAVVGVEYDDVLNVREKPGTDQAIVATLEPTYDNIVALGVTRQLPRSFWYEVDVDGTRGWVSARFVAYLGSTDDITSGVVEQLGGTIPEASSMDALAEIVADTLVSIDPPSVVTTTVAASAGDLGEITIDIIGIGDDSVRGFRLVIFGQSEDGGATFGLKSVESTTLCDRGVTEDGLCV